MSIATVAVSRRFRRVVFMSSWGRKPRSEKPVSIAIGAIFEQPWSGHGRGGPEDSRIGQHPIPLIIAVFCHHHHHHQIKRLASLQAVPSRGKVPCIPWPYELAETNPMLLLKAVGVNYRRPLTSALGIVQLTFGGFLTPFQPLIRANTRCLILEAPFHCSSLASLAVRRQNGVIFSFTGTRMTAFCHLHEDARSPR